MTSRDVVAALPMADYRVRPALFVDIDGTVRHGLDELGRFVNGPDDVVVFPEAVKQMRRWKDATGGRIFGVSNQGGIALGHVRAADVDAAMRETRRQAEGLIDAIYYCPHHVQSKVPAMAHCWCRKPAPGLVHMAADYHGFQCREVYPPHLALMVGDRPEDAECAARAGIAFQTAAEWRARP